MVVVEGGAAVVHGGERWWGVEGDQKHAATNQHFALVITYISCVLI